VAGQGDQVVGPVRGQDAGRRRCLGPPPAQLAGGPRAAPRGGGGDAERAVWRKQGLKWLRADLKALIMVLDRDPAAYRGVIRQVLPRCREAPELACARDSGEVDKLPADEREEFASLWADVAAVLARTEK